MSQLSVLSSITARVAHALVALAQQDAPDLEYWSAHFAAEVDSYHAAGGNDPSSIVSYLGLELTAAHNEERIPGIVPLAEQFSDRLDWAREHGIFDGDVGDNIWWSSDTLRVVQVSPALNTATSVPAPSSPHAPSPQPAPFPQPASSSQPAPSPQPTPSSLPAPSSSLPALSVQRAPSSPPALLTLPAPSSQLTPSTQPAPSAQPEPSSPPARSAQPAPSSQRVPSPPPATPPQPTSVHPAGGEPTSVQTDVGSSGRPGASTSASARRRPPGIREADLVLKARPMALMHARRAGEAPSQSDPYLEALKLKGREMVREEKEKEKEKAKAKALKKTQGVGSSSAPRSVAPTSVAPPPPSTTNPAPSNAQQVPRRPSTPPMFATEGEERSQEANDATEETGNKRKAPPGATSSWKPTNMAGFKHRKTSIRLFPPCEQCKRQGYPADCRRPINSSGACNACHFRKVPCDWSHWRHNDDGQRLLNDPPVIRPKRVMRKRAVTQKPTSVGTEHSKASNKGKGKAKAKSVSPGPSAGKGKGKAKAAPVADDGEPVAKRLRGAYKSAEYIEDSDEELRQMEHVMQASRRDGKSFILTSSSSVSHSS
ncbi:hypothetical protein DENSPDRAFT_886772 [Dentipellis sp. KUC8613]|nr:hypothetical protein DENSPDRAFT_886772 [Dentipellis sp. KUC8613]